MQQASSTENEPRLGAGNSALRCARGRTRMLSANPRPWRHGGWCLPAALRGGSMRALPATRTVWFPRGQLDLLTCADAAAWARNGLMEP